MRYLAESDALMLMGRRHGHPGRALPSQTDQARQRQTSSDLPRVAIL
jgi:hypothetical protein